MCKRLIWVTASLNRAVAIYIAATLSISGAAAGSLNPCPENPKSSEFVHCTRTILETLNAMSVVGAVVSDPLRGLLQAMANSSGYKGNKDDVDLFKRTSMALKGDPIRNGPAIAILDNAIASDITEIRPALSISRLVAEATPGTDIYQLFLQQKLTYLSSDEARFYDKGPFDLVRRTVLAGALEGAFFEKKKDGVSAPELLRKELVVLDEIEDRLTTDRYGYLPAASVQPRNMQINSTRFWKASVAFALGDKDKVRTILRDLINSNAKIPFNRQNPGQIYIFKVFDEPFKIVVTPSLEDNGNRKVNVVDPLILRRYYNPAQLATIACAQLGKAGSGEGINALAKSIIDLTPHDYYVVVASADDAGKLEKLGTAIEGVLEAKEVAPYLEQVNSEDEEFARGIRRGARECNINDGVADHVYSPFSFEHEISREEDTKKAFLVYGGALDEAQARRVADLLNRIIKDLNAPWPEPRAYVTRMRIDTLGAKQNGD